VAADPAAGTIYVANHGYGTVSVINVATRTVTGTIPVGSGPFAVAADPAAGTVYVANAGNNAVSVINAATRTVTATIPVGNSPYGVAVNPATHTAYVANDGNNTVSVISAAVPVSGPIVSGYRAGKCVADRGDSAANDTPITIATCDHSPSQHWTVTGSGTLQVHGKCLDIYRDEKQTMPPSSSGPAPAALTSNGTPPPGRWSTRYPANASTTPGSASPPAPGWTSTPARAAPTSNGKSPDRARRSAGPPPPDADTTPPPARPRLATRHRQLAPIFHRG
jgi:YVTN family beta-propeller protein